MVDVTIHLRGKPAERRAFPAVPRSGEIIDADGQLWRVVEMVMGESVRVYAVKAASELGEELAAWADAPASLETPQTTKGLFPNEQ